MAEVYSKGGIEKNVILSVRQDLVQGFEAPDWQDLRVGWFVSVTDASNDDLTTGLDESIPNPPLAIPTDRFWVGLKDRSDLFPKEQGCTYIGFTNASPEPRIPEVQGESNLISSDIQTGAGTDYWRPENSDTDYWVAMATDNLIVRAHTNRPGSQLHLIQDEVSVGAYASLWMMRLQRPTPDSRTITITMKIGTRNGDVLYTDDPSFARLLTNLENFPATVQQLGPVELSRVPDAFFAFWPWTGSRLRIHNMGFASRRMS